MTTYVALDLSVKSTGFAIWSTGQAKPVAGTWALAPGIDWASRAFVRLHRNLMDLHRVTAIDAIVHEEALPAHAVRGNTNLATLKAAAGLAAHVASFAEAVGARHREVNISAWRRHFIGKMPRGTKSVDLKAMAMTRCRELGLEVNKHDAAEACGLLDFELSVDGIIAPWRSDAVLVREMMPATDGRRAAA